MRFLARPALRDSLLGLLDTDRKRAAYEASDGASTSREVGAAAGVSHVTIQRWWEEWLRAGVIRAGKVAGRGARIVSLNEVGVPMTVAEIG